MKPIILNGKKYQRIPGFSLPPIEVDFNPGRKLKPVGTSGRIFWNDNPKYIKGNFQKGRPEYADYLYLDDNPIMPLGGMIYWYGWGNQQFDVRDLRVEGGLPEDFDEDMEFTIPYVQLELMARHLNQITLENDLDTILKKILIPLT